MFYICPVCNFDKLKEPPERWNICPCCGTEFEYHDVGHSHAELRKCWIAKGAPWFSRAMPAPEGWEPPKE